MGRDGRGAVVSVRITDADQQKLRRLAQERGTSVSEIVRSAAMREAGGESSVATVTLAPTSRAPEIGRGLIWEPVPGAHVDRTTITF